MLAVFFLLRKLYGMLYKFYLININVDEEYEMQ